MEKIVRAWRRATRAEEADADRRQQEARSLSVYVDEDGMYVIRGRLMPEVGALLERALAAASAALPAHDGGDDAAQRRADALGVVAERALAARPNGRGVADRYQVVLHVDAEALEAGSERGESALEDGTHVSAETSRRIACDASLVRMMSDASGRTLDVGRRARTVPPALRRALTRRDRGCRFPGCGLRICDAHHIVHWADGGETKLENLVLLCRRHHRAVHEEGFTVRVTARGAIEFRRPDDRVLPNAPVLAARGRLEEVRAPAAVRTEWVDVGYAAATYLRLEAAAP